MDELVIPIALVEAGNENKSKNVRTNLRHTGDYSKARRVVNKFDGMLCFHGLLQLLQVILPAPNSSSSAIR